MYTKQLNSRYTHITFRENWHVSTEAQLILNKFQVHKILRIQINVVEKKENNVQNRTFIFSCAYATMKPIVTLRQLSTFKG